MKRLIALLLPVLVSCTVVDAVLMTKFDNIEYHQITEIRVDASMYKNQCSNPLLAQSNATALAYKTELYEKYSQELPHNDNGYKAAKSLNEIAQGLATRYTESTPVSPLFCKLKMSNVENTAEIIQHVIGSRPR